MAPSLILSMTTGNGYTEEQINKIGNTLIYLSTHIKPLSKTKALKLLYLLDENSVKKFSAPFLGLEYVVWQAGPVSSDIYHELNSGPNLLEGFITLHCENEGTFINPVKEFNDDEFSDNEIEFMDSIISSFKDKTAEQLVKYTHRESSLWYKLAKEHNLLEAFEKKRRNTSDVKIDLSQLIADDPQKLAFYHEIKDFL